MPSREAKLEVKEFFNDYGELPSANYKRAQAFNKLSDEAQAMILKQQRRERKARNLGLLARKVVTVAAGLVLAVIGFVGAVAGLIALSALLIYVAWNLGVDGFADAVGAPVEDVSFWTAVGGGFIVGTLSRILHGGSSLTVNKSS